MGRQVVYLLLAVACLIAHHQAARVPRHIAAPIAEEILEADITQDHVMTKADSPNQKHLKDDAVTPAATGCLEDQPFVYHNYETVLTYLQCIVGRYPLISDYYSIGTSVQGRDLLVIAMGTNPAEHVTLRPELMYNANIHGDEVIGHELVIHLIDYLMSNYETSARVQTLLDNTRVHILLSMNPDGFERAYNSVPRCLGVVGSPGRTNANGFDLNRNFPDPFNPNDVERQPETLAVMAWLDDYRFILGGTMHGGAMVMNYPHDSYVGAPAEDARYSLSSDEDIFRYISLSYTWDNPDFQQEDICGARDFFEFGITNGASWYPVVGGVQDYSYSMYGVAHVTMELHCCKYPDPTELERFWSINQESLIRYLETYNNGVRGIVADQSGEPIEGAIVSFAGRDWSMETMAYGEFFRMLVPGPYTIEVSADGYLDYVEDFTILNYNRPVTLQVTLISASNTLGDDPK